jgi:hypothetical protein
MPATYEPIATTTLGSAAANITFSTIPGTYTDLRLVLVARTSSGGDVTQLEINGTAGTSYSFTRIIGNGSSAFSSQNSNFPFFYLTDEGTNTTLPDLITIDLFSYAGSTNKTILFTANEDRNGSGKVGYGVGLFRSTSAITSLKLFNNAATNFAAGTTATLYGIKAA